jgi:hypothetical protein
MNISGLNIAGKSLKQAEPDARHNFSEQEANAFYDEALEAHKKVMIGIAEELFKNGDLIAMPCFK